MQPAHRRHDISDTVWQILEPHLLGRKGTWGGNQGNRMNAIVVDSLEYSFTISGLRGVLFTGDLFV